MAADLPPDQSSNPARPNAATPNLAFRGAVVFTGILLTQLVAFALIGPGPPDLVLWPSLLFWLACPFLAVGLVVVGKVRRASWSQATLFGLTALIPMAGAPVSSSIYWGTRRHAYERLARRSMPVIEAVQRFEAEYGLPPAELGELVPRYLEAVPGTGVWLVSDFGYWSDGADWGFQIECSSGFPNWDEFFWPPPPADQRGPDIELIGGWAYYHE